MPITPEVDLLRGGSPCHSGPGHSWPPVAPVVHPRPPTGLARSHWPPLPHLHLHPLNLSRAPGQQGDRPRAKSMQPTHTPDCFLQAQEANDSARRRQNVLCEGLKHCLELSVSRELPPSTPSPTDAKPCINTKRKTDTNCTHSARSGRSQVCFHHISHSFLKTGLCLG